MTSPPSKTMRAEARRRLQQADPNLKIVSGRPAKAKPITRMPRVLSPEEAKQWGLPELMPIIPPDEILEIEGHWSKKALQGLALEYYIDPNGTKDILIEKLMYIGAMDQDGHATGKSVQELRERAVPSIVPQTEGFKHSKRYLINSKERLIYPKPFDTSYEALQYAAYHIPQYRVVLFGHQAQKLLGEGYKVASTEPKSSTNGAKAPMTVGYTIKDLQKAYEEARRTNKDEFSLAGFDFATGYAKYLLEYLLEVRKVPADTPLQDILRKAPRVPYTVPVVGPKFDMGRVVVTAGVNEEIADNEEFAKFVMASLRRHGYGDWGEMAAEDKKANDEAIGKQLRIFSAYEKYPLRKIWIITEADRSATTILFPDEY